MFKNIVSIFPNQAHKNLNIALLLHTYVVRNIYLDSLLMNEHLKTILSLSSIFLKQTEDPNEEWGLQITIRLCNTLTNMLIFLHDETISYGSLPSEHFLEFLQLLEKLLTKRNQEVHTYVILYLFNIRFHSDLSGLASYYPSMSTLLLHPLCVELQTLKPIVCFHLCQQYTRSNIRCPWYSDFNNYLS